MSTRSLVILLSLGAVCAAIFWPRKSAGTAPRAALPTHGVLNASPQHAPRALLTPTHAPTQSPETIVAPEGVLLTVHVRDTSERAVAHARVRLEGLATSGEVVTDEVGTATLLAPLGVDFRIVAISVDGGEGALDWFLCENRADDPTSCFGSDSESDRDVQVEVIDVATLTGVVVDERGEGIAGANLRLLPLENALDGDASAAMFDGNPDPDGAMPLSALAVPEGDTAAVLTTDIDGTFSLPLREAGSFFVVAVADGHVAAASEPVQLVDGQVAHITITLAAGHEYSGQVVDDRGDPVGDATVALMTETSIQSRETDANGAFRFVGIREATAEVTARHEAFLPSEPASISPSAADTQLLLRRGASIELHVCAQGSSELRVIARSTDSYRIVASSVAELASGCVDTALRGLECGEWDVSLIGTGVYHSIGKVQVTDAPLRLNVNIPEGFVVAGRVELPGSDEPTRCMLQLTNGLGFATRISIATDGHFSFSGEFQNADTMTTACRVGDQHRLVRVSTPVRTGDRNLLIRLPPPEPVAVEEVATRQQERISSDAPETAQTCSISLAYRAFRGSLVVTSVFGSDLPVRVIAGDVFVDSRGDPMSPELVATYGRCGSRTTLHLHRPATNQTYALSVLFDNEN